jgi:plastocyanin
MVGSLISAGGALRVDGESSGSIKGRVIISAPLAARTVKVTSDDKICGSSVPDETIVADKSGGIAHALVTVKGLPWNGPAVNPHIVNKGCRFTPHVGIARPGTTLEVTSDDQTLHTTHLYGADGKSIFNIALPMPGMMIKRPFDKNTGVLRLACDTHPWMQGFVAVSQDRGVVTGSDGVFQIDDVPPGTREVSVWHESLKGASQSVTVVAGGTADVQFVLAAR